MSRLFFYVPLIFSIPSCSFLNVPIIIPLSFPKKQKEVEEVEEGEEGGGGAERGKKKKKKVKDNNQEI